MPISCLIYLLVVLSTVYSVREPRFTPQKNHWYDKFLTLFPVLSLTLAQNFACIFLLFAVCLNAQYNLDFGRLNNGRSLSSTRESGGAHTGGGSNRVHIPGGSVQAASGQGRQHQGSDQAVTYVGQGQSPSDPGIVYRVSERLCLDAKAVQH